MPAAQLAVQHQRGVHPVPDVDEEEIVGEAPGAQPVLGQGGHVDVVLHHDVHAGGQAVLETGLEVDAGPLRDGIRQHHPAGRVDDARHRDDGGVQAGGGQLPLLQQLAGEHPHLRGALRRVHLRGGVVPDGRHHVSAQVGEHARRAVQAHVDAGDDVGVGLEAEHPGGSAGALRVRLGGGVGGDEAVGGQFAENRLHRRPGQPGAPGEEPDRAGLLFAEHLDAGRSVVAPHRHQVLGMGATDPGQQQHLPWPAVFGNSASK